MRTRRALEEVSALIKQCYGPHDEDLPKLLRIIVYVHNLRGYEAVNLIRELKPTSKFFLVFALGIYGFQLEPLRVGDLRK